MRLLDTDVDLILLAATVAVVVWAVQPGTDTVASSDVAAVCQEATCCAALPMRHEAPFEPT